MNGGPLLERPPRYSSGEARGAMLVLSGGSGLAGPCAPAWFLAAATEWEAVHVADSRLGATADVSGPAGAVAAALRVYRGEVNDAEDVAAVFVRILGGGGFERWRRR